MCRSLDLGAMDAAEDYGDLEVALERLRDPADPVLDWLAAARCAIKK